MIVDAHFHAWRLDRGDYGWLTPALGPIHRDVSIDDWAAQAAPHGVARGVLVQAAPTAAETAWLLRRAAHDDRVHGVVGWTDLAAPDAPAAIARLAAEPKLVGLRPMLQDLPDPDWILRPDLRPGLEAIARHGLVFDALVLPVHLPRIIALADALPALRIVLDHGGKPGIAAGDWQPWADDIDRLAARPQVHAKLSGLLTEAGPAPAPAAARRWAAHLLAAFGPRRLLWGSDWPVLELAARYGDWWREAAALLGPLAADDRAAVLGGNALRVYRTASVRSPAT